MNDSLVDLYHEGEIENTEVLKRICEQANQNVYLALFHNPETDKSNIKFDLANFDKISEVVSESEEAMKDYYTPPKDFRTELEIAVAPKSTETSESEKLSELNEAVEYRQVFRNFLNRIEIMKTAEYHLAEESLNNMADDAKIMIHNGESIGDISKIATKFVKENLEGDFVKVAKCYDYIYKTFIESGFHPKTGFTKLSSQKINEKSEVLKPVKDFSHSIAKIAGLVEMEKNIKKVLGIFDTGIQKEING
jgi:hypothetical protein